MNPEVKAKWLKALRSGEYQQDRGFLRDKHDKYCCLGVLCDLYSKEKNVPWRLSEDNQVYRMHISVSAPTDEVHDWAGFGSYIPTVKYNGEQLTVITLNDDYKLSFEDIAKIIEEQM